MGSRGVPLLMLLPLMLCCTRVLSGDKGDSDLVVVLHEQAQEVNKQVAEQAEKLAAIEHFLADKNEASKGGAPKGWVQPPLSAYGAPEAPESFLPPPVDP